MERILLMVLRNLGLIPAAWMKLCHYAKHSNKYSYEEKYKHIRYILTRAVETGNIDLRVTGLERIPAEDGFLLCGNHQGMFDILAIVAAFDRPIAAVLKKELKDIPFIKQIIACTHSYPMDREDVRQSMQVIMAVTKELKKGRNILIFPEGTRSKKGNRMMDFHSGTFKCVIQSKCPIVPFALVDSYKVMDQKHSDPVTVHLEFLDPIYYEEYAELKTVEIAELVRGRIEESIDRMLEK